MRVRLGLGVVAAAVAVAFSLGWLAAVMMGPAPPLASAPVAGGPPVELPAAITQRWFAPIADYDTGGEPLSHEAFDGLLRSLRTALAAPETTANFEVEAPIHLYNFMRRVTIPEVTAEQLIAFKELLEAVAGERPQDRELLESNVESLETYYAAAGDRVPPLAGASAYFKSSAHYDTGGEVFADETFDELVRTLDGLLDSPEATDRFEDEARLHFWRFNNRLQQGRLSADQIRRVGEYLDGVAAAHPGLEEFLASQRFVAENLVPGNVAPEIVGNDLDGAEFRLSDYRGRIVVLFFTGHWCGPCRTEYPYQRLMLEVWEEEPAVLLGVNSDESLEIVREAKAQERLDYRMWWDGHGEDAQQGPIATSWNTVAWPTTYILDRDGVIRYVNKRHEEIITAVKGLLEERRGN